MDVQLLLGLAAFALVASGTPGPNNVMIMASGANFGLRRSVPHLFGITLGVAIMVMAAGLGLGQVFTLWEGSKPLLAGLSVLYLLWLASRVARSAAPEAGEATATPFTFLQAAAFQWVNPKAWTMVLTAVTLYASGSLGGVILVAATFFAVGLPAVTAWLLLGTRLRVWLAVPGRLRAFNWTMAALLVLSIWPSVAPLLLD